jgi:hypothetical protein
MPTMSDQARRKITNRQRKMENANKRVAKAEKRERNTKS